MSFMLAELGGLCLLFLYCISNHVTVDFTCFNVSGSHLLRSSFQTS